MVSGVLIFDLGGVLVENEMFDQLPRMSARNLAGDELKSRWLRSRAVRTFELGRCSPREFASSLVDEFRLTVSPGEFVSAFSAWPTGFSAGAVELLRKLRSQYVVGCLSNSNELHWTDDVTGHFDHAVRNLLRRCCDDGMRRYSFSY